MKVNFFLDCLERAMEANQHELKLQNVSDSMALPKHIFARRLMQVCNMSFPRLRNLYLMEKALRLIETDLTLNEISDRLGFYRTSYFSKVFRDMFGCSPSEYRKQVVWKNKLLMEGKKFTPPTNQPNSKFVRIQETRELATPVEPIQKIDTAEHASIFVAQAKVYISRNLEHFSSQRMSLAFGVSRSNLIARFKRHTGMTPVAYAKQLR